MNYNDLNLVYNRNNYDLPPAGFKPVEKVELTPVPVKPKPKVNHRDEDRQAREWFKDMERRERHERQQKMDSWATLASYAAVWLGFDYVTGEGVFKDD